MVPAVGITGGIKRGVWYFGTAKGLSVPPGIWADAPAAAIKPSKATDRRTFRNLPIIMILPSY
jgi:hypothetical protein